MTAQRDYFPVSLGRRSEHFWRNWLQAFPQARVWPGNEKQRVYSEHDLPECSMVVVGIPGITPEIALKWMMSDHRPTAREVTEALHPTTTTTTTGTP